MTNKTNKQVMTVWGISLESVELLSTHTSFYADSIIAQHNK